MDWLHIIAVSLGSLVIGYALGRMASEYIFIRRQQRRKDERARRRRIKGLEDRPPAHPGAIGTARVRTAKIRNSRQMQEE